MTAQSSKAIVLTIALSDFAGPFDVLFALVRAHQYPVDRLPVGQITAQFLAYIRAAEELDVELGAEFLEVASWLTLLYSRSLLPGASALAGQLPPEAEASRELAQVMMSKFEAEQIAARLVPTSGVRFPGASPSHMLPPQQVPFLPSLLDVVEMARTALEAARAASSLVADDGLHKSVEEQMTWLFAYLIQRQEEEVLLADTILAAQASDADRVSFFLALLELARSGSILLEQSAPLRPLRFKSAGVVRSTVGGLAATTQAVG